MAKNFIALQKTLLEVQESVGGVLVNTNAILAAVGEEVKADSIKRYGLKINKNDSNPETRCTYLFDAVGMQPARMNYETGVFDYGDWADVFFVKNNYPAMVKYDGTEDYRLDPNDHALKEDGTPSDVANVEYEGNAMSVFDGTVDGKIWISQYEIGNYEYMVISNVRYDESFRDDAYVREDGTSADKLYYPMFSGSYDGTRLRSLAGQRQDVNYIMRDEIDKAKANGENWSIGSWSRINLLNCMLGILSKSDDTQTAFGNGCADCYVASEDDNYGRPLTGTLIDKGQFFGYNEKTYDVKVFYMESRWGAVDERIYGLLNKDGKILVKMTPPYNMTGAGYEDTGLVLKGTAEGYISETHSSRLGRIPCKAEGSTTMYTCDGLWFDNNDSTKVATIGGSAFDNNEKAIGAYALRLLYPATYRRLNGGVSLYLDQPAEEEAEA